MLTLQVLGTGCARCQKLAAETRAAADALGVAYSLEKVTDIQQIMNCRVMMTPALVVEGVVKVAGRIPSAAEITAWLGAAAEQVEHPK